MENPKIRFKGFTKDWEQRKLNEVAEKICVGFVGTCEKFYTDESGIPMYRTGNLNGLSLNRDDLKYVTNEFHQHNQKSQLKAGDILIARHGDSGKAVNYENSEEANCLNIVIIRPDFKKRNYKFLTNCINSPECQKHIKSLSAGSTQAVINTSEIEKLGVVIPANIDEQNRIARYFSTLDNLITLHQRKCEQTKKLKKYMLQKMFPRNGAKVPEIRFDGFTYDWEQRKLGDMGSTFTGLSGKTKEDFGHGDAQFITYMNVFSNPVANLEMTEAVEIDAKQNRVKKGDVFFTTSSETPEEVGMSCVMPENKDNIYLNSFCFGYRPTEKFDLDYLAYVLRADSFRKEMKFLAQGISRYNISKNKVMEVSIPIPNLEEQTMVGRYFSTLDHLITLHQRKCDELKKMKKYMLQNMFI